MNLNLALQRSAKALITLCLKIFCLRLLVCLDLNREIGSSDKSQHVKAEAVDFVVPGIPNIYLAQWIADNLNYDQLILEFWDEEKPNKGWVHCSYKNSYENRYQILTVSKTGAVFGLPFQSD